MRSLAHPLVASLVLALPAAAQTLDAVEFGDPITGPRVNPSDLKGRVVLVEEWGVHCGPCTAAMPKIVELHRELGPFGLAVVAPHQASFGTRKEARERAAARGYTFPIPASDKVPGRRSGGVPHCFLYDAAGKQLFEGHPNKVEPEIRAAMAQLWLGDRASPGEVWADPVKAVAEWLREGKAPAAALKKLLPLQSASNKAAAADAKFLATGLLAPGKAALEAATAQASSDPAAAYDQAVLLETVLKDAALGKKAGEVAAKLRGHKAVLAERKARDGLVVVELYDHQLLALRKEGGAGPAAARAAETIKKDMQKLLTKLKQTQPTAPATKIALEIGSGHGVEVK